MKMGGVIFLNCLCGFHPFSGSDSPRKKKKKLLSLLCCIKETSMLSRVRFLSRNIFLLLK